MGMVRQDPLTGRWVMYAAGRSRRPNEFPRAQRNTESTDHCPFCPGHEDQTTPEIVAIGRPDGTPANGPGWRMRAFPNLFPAVESDPGGVAVGEKCDALHRQTPGAGLHQVVVYTPDHASGPCGLDVQQWKSLLAVLRKRSLAVAKHPAVRYVSVFCNHGPEAGATLVHPHMQVLGVPEIPLLAALKATRSATYFARHARCLVCDLAESERAAGDRLIGSNDHWTGYTPWASRFPWEMLFVPRRHISSLRAASRVELAALAAVLVPALGALGRMHGDLSLNIVSHGAAVNSAGEDEESAGSHWHLEVLPRLARPAGFEVGTGGTINSVAPEDAAAGLRPPEEQS